MFFLKKLGTRVDKKKAKTHNNCRPYSMSAVFTGDQVIAEVSFLRHYVQALETKDATAIQAVLWGLPLIMVNPSTMFISQLAVAGGAVTLRDALLLADSNYAAQPSYALVGTAVDAVMAVRSGTMARCKVLQERLHSTDDTTYEST